MEFPYLSTFAATALLTGLAIASYHDWRTREVPDELWMAIGGLGTILLFLGDYGGGLLTIARDLLIAFFAMEHLFPWDRPFEAYPSAVKAVEGALYTGVISFTIYGYLFQRTLVSAPFLAIVVAILVTRALFEARLLYGGADAKALIASALLLPFWAQPLFMTYLAGTSSTFLPYLPFAFTILVNGSLFTLVIPLGLLIHNFREGFHHLPDALLNYEISTSELPHRFVWLRRPSPKDSDVATSEEDVELRKTEARELLAQGVERVWVTPQIPMIIFLFSGAIFGILFGNILFLLLSA